MWLCWRDELTLRGALGQGISPIIFGPDQPTTQHLRVHHSYGQLNYAYCKGEAYFSITASTGWERKDYSWQLERHPRVEAWIFIQRHHRHLWPTHIRHQPTRTGPDFIPECIWRNMGFRPNLFSMMKTQHFPFISIKACLFILQDGRKCIYVRLPLPHHNNHAPLRCSAGFGLNALDWQQVLFSEVGAEYLAHYSSWLWEQL